MKIAIADINIVANTTELTAIAESSLDDRDIKYIDEESIYMYYKLAENGDLQPDDATNNIGWWVKKNEATSRCIMTIVPDGYDFGSNLSTDVSNIKNWYHLYHILDNIIIARSEIESLIAAKTFAACDDAEKLIGTKLIVVSKSDRDSIGRTDAEQLDDAMHLQALIDRKYNKDDLLYRATSIRDGGIYSAVPTDIEDYDNAGMLSIANPIKKQRIFNTTWGKIYYFDGDVWLSDGLTKCVNQSGTSMVEGNPVIQDGGSDDGVDLTSSTNSIAIIGVVKDVYNGGGDGEFVTVAVGGEHNVLFNNGSVSRGNAVVQSNTQGQAYDTAFGATGTFGIARGSKGSGSGLVKCWIQPTERY